MPKFMLIGRLASEGVKGLLDKGGTTRQDAVRDTVKGAGGTLESFHFAFGDDDVYVIADLPDNEAAAAVAMTIAASGIVGARTVVLLTPEQVDVAAKRKVSFRPPGS